MINIKEILLFLIYLTLLVSCNVQHSTLLQVKREIHQSNVELDSIKQHLRYDQNKGVEDEQ